MRGSGEGGREGMFLEPVLLNVLGGVRVCFKKGYEGGRGRVLGVNRTKEERER